MELSSLSSKTRLGRPAAIERTDGAALPRRLFLHSLMLLPSQERGGAVARSAPLPYIPLP